MKIYQLILCIIDVILMAADSINDGLHILMRRVIRRTRRNIKRYGVVYYFILTKIFAIAMLGVGIHCMVAHFNKVLPFGIVSENTGLWVIWAYTGWFIGGCLVTYGLYKFFERQIYKWVSTMINEKDR